MNLTKTLPMAVLGLLAFAACGSDDLEGTANLDNAASVAPAGEAAAVIPETTPATDPPVETAEEPTTTQAPATTAAPTTTIPAQDPVGLLYIEACPYRGATATDDNGNSLNCVSIPGGLQWTIMPEAMERDAQVALLTCSKTLLSNVTDAALGDEADWSACDQAEVLLELEGSAYAKSVGTQLGGCTFDANKMIAQLKLNAMAGQNGKSTVTVKQLSACETMLSDLAAA